MSPTRRRRPMRAAAVLTVAVLVVGGCSIPTDESAAPLAPNELPAALQPDATTVVPSTLPPQIPSAEAVIYLQRQTDDVDTIGDLVAVTRPVSENSLRNALEALVTSGVTPTETEAGLITQFEPADGQPIQISIVGRPDPQTVVLDLSSAPTGVGPSNKVWVAQIVFTATEFTDVQMVVIRIAGQDVQVATDAGDNEPGVPVGRADFVSLDPDARPPSTTTSTSTTTPAQPPQTGLPPTTTGGGGGGG